MSKLGEIAMIDKILPDLNKRERLVLSHIADCHTERMGSNTLSCNAEIERFTVTRQLTFPPPAKPDFLCQSRRTTERKHPAVPAIY